MIGWLRTRFRKQPIISLYFGKLKNDVLMTLFANFQNGRQKSWNLTYYWIISFIDIIIFIQNHKYYVLR